MTAPQYVDISAFQPTNVDWLAYRKWAAQWDGVARVAMRSSYGTGYTDKNYAVYRQGALAAGVDVIIYYHYAYPSLNSAAAEADWQRSVVGNIRPDDVLMLDYEDGSSQATAAWALAWLQRQENNYGKLPTIYASLDYALSHLGLNALARYPLTLADWNYDPNIRPAAPYPWDSYTYLQFTDHGTLVPGLGTSAVDVDVYVLPGGQVAPITPNGEVLSLNQADQMQPGLSQFECGVFACAMLRSGDQPGKVPQRTVQQVINDAEMWYAQPNQAGSDTSDAGMSLPQLYSLIQQMTYDYRVIDLSNNPLGYIRAWVKQGYPVIIAGPEAGMYDIDLGDVVPYPWTPSGNHIIDVTGVLPDGNLIVRDSANVTNLYDPTTLRPGPRHYDASRLSLVSATAVVMPWLPSPPPGYDPTKGIIMPLPNGWTDDGTALHNPTNAHTVQAGFRNHILAAASWANWNVPLEGEEVVTSLEEVNPALGAGSRQLFVDTQLEWQKSSNSVFEGFLGQELFYVRTNRNAWQARYNALVIAGQDAAKVAAAALAACEAATGGITPAEQAAINNASSGLSTILAALQQFVK